MNYASARFIDLLQSRKRSQVIQILCALRKLDRREEAKKNMRMTPAEESRSIRLCSEAKISKGRVEDDLISNLTFGSGAPLEVGDLERDTLMDGLFCGRVQLRFKEVMGWDGK